MATIRYAEAFFEDAAGITSDKLQEELKRTLLAITDFPEIGSSNAPESIKRLYGHGIRKINVGPFLLVYRYLREEGTVSLYGLIHSKTVR